MSTLKCTDNTPQVLALTLIEMSKISIDSEFQANSLSLENSNLKKALEASRIELDKMMVVLRETENKLSKREVQLDDAKANLDIRTGFINDLIKDKRLSGRTLSRAKNLIVTFLVRNGVSSKYAMAE